MKSNDVIKRHTVVEALLIIRKEWEEAAQGERLDFVEGSVGLLLQDVVRGIGLTPQEI